MVTGSGCLGWDGVGWGDGGVVVVWWLCEGDGAVVETW